MARTPAKGASSIPNASPGELWRYGCSLRHGLNRATTRCAGRRQWSPPDLLVIGSPKEREYSCRGREIVLELGGGNRNQLPNALWGIHSKRIQLENYLKAEKAAGRDKGQRTILHLMARLGLTEAEVLQASFGSKHLVRRLAVDPTTLRADAILLEYVDR